MSLIKYNRLLKYHNLKAWEVVMQLYHTHLLLRERICVWPSVRERASTLWFYIWIVLASFHAKKPSLSSSLKNHPGQNPLSSPPVKHSLPHSSRKCRHKDGHYLTMRIIFFFLPLSQWPLLYAFGKAAINTCDVFFPSSVALVGQAQVLDTKMCGPRSLRGPELSALPRD